MRSLSSPEFTPSRRSSPVHMGRRRSAPTRSHEFGPETPHARRFDSRPLHGRLSENGESWEAVFVACTKRRSASAPAWPRVRSATASAIVSVCRKDRRIRACCHTLCRSVTLGRSEGLRGSDPTMHSPAHGRSNPNHFRRRAATAYPLPGQARPLGTGVGLDHPPVPSYRR